MNYENLHRGFEDPSEWSSSVFEAAGKEQPRPHTAQATRNPHGGPKHLQRTITTSPNHRHVRPHTPPLQDPCKLPLSPPQTPGCDEHMDIDADPEEEEREISEETISIATPTATQPTVPSLLLNLPLEIRHQIYEQFRHTQPSSVPKIYCLSPFAGLKQHPLARICRQIRSEALALVYSQNIWTIKLEYEDFYTAFRHWVESVGSHAQDLRVVYLSLRSPHLARAKAPSVGQTKMSWKGEGEATFEIDLSERWQDGRVRVQRSEPESANLEFVLDLVQSMVLNMWRKKYSTGGLQWMDWVRLATDLMDSLDTRWWMEKKLKERAAKAVKVEPVSSGVVVPSS